MWDFSISLRWELELILPSCAATGCNLKDWGIKVTSDPLNSEISQVYEVTETQEVTVSNPSVIYIRLTVGF